MKRFACTLAISILVMVAVAAAQTGHPVPLVFSAGQVNAIYPEVEALYIDLHRNPELGFHEQRSAAHTGRTHACAWI